MIASKYMNDEGEAESVLNSEWTKIGKSVIIAVNKLLQKHLGRINSSYVATTCVNN